MNEYKLQAPKGSISLTEENTKTETITYTTPRILGPDTCLQMMARKSFQIGGKKTKSWGWAELTAMSPSDLLQIGHV